LIEYRTLPGVPGTYFDCPNNLGMLSVKACGSLWSEAMTREAIHDGRRVTCRCCRVGQAHASGDTVQNDGQVEGGRSALLGTKSCARCGRQNGRLVRGAVCISCYNRELEWIKGRNGKGTAPKFVRPVFPASVAAIYASSQGAPRKLHYRKLDHVADRVSEPILTVARFALSPVFLPVLVGIAFARTEMAHGEQMPLFVPSPDELAKSAVELSRRRKKAAASAGWEVTDHVCRTCWGRILKRPGQDGEAELRCANCGASAHGKEDALCCCGIEVDGKHPFECVANPDQSIAPAEIAVREREQAATTEKVGRTSNPVRFEW